MIFIWSKLKKRLLHVVIPVEIANSKGQNRIDISESSEMLQVSRLNFDGGKFFPAHAHISKSVDFKNIVAQEAWVVIRGKVAVTFFDLDDSRVASYILNPGDCSITFSGGHAYEILENDSLIYEFKIGPYLGRELDKREISWK